MLGSATVCVPVSRPSPPLSTTPSSRRAWLSSFSQKRRLLEANQLVWHSSLLGKKERSPEGIMGFFFHSNTIYYSGALFLKEKVLVGVNQNQLLKETSSLKARGEL